MFDDLNELLLSLIIILNHSFCKKVKSLIKS